jgi:hypothetical protein
MTQTITISTSGVKDFDLSDLQEYHQFSDEWFEGVWVLPAGITEYLLYAYLSHQVFGATILDIGTRSGGSAIALSSNPLNKVISFDIVEWPSYTQLHKDNIELRIGNFMEDNIDYRRVDIIMIDVDPHDGLQEPPMLQFLLDKGWSGLLLLDDIGPPWPAIQSWWNSLPYEKYDLTDIGHWSGTGLVNIGDKFKIRIEE